jgi:hypothetical protein
MTTQSTAGPEVKANLGRKFVKYNKYYSVS